MKRLVLILSLTLLFAGLKAQNSLFDDSRVSSVYIRIHPDSLEYIMEHVLSDHYFTATFIFDDGINLDTVEQAGFRLRGNTSRYAQKKSFKISFNEYVSGRRYQGVKKINLNGQHNDPSMLREKLFYELWKNAGMPERRAGFVKLYINDAYYGLYTNLEEFDKDWLERVYGENDGNLYKCTYPSDLVYLGEDQQKYKDINSSSITGGRAYDLQTNESEDDYSGLVDLIRCLHRAPDTAFAREIKTLLDVDMCLEALALDVATGNWDDYFYNKNNYFLYQGADGRFRFISYDTDNTFGVDWFNIDWAQRNCLSWYNHQQSRPLITKLLSVPEFNKKYKAYLDSTARYIIHPDSVFPRISSLQQLITEAAVEDDYRTRDYGYSISDFVLSTEQSIDSHTPYGIKPFLSKRQAKIFEQLGTPVPPKEKAQPSRAILFPNPVKSELSIRLNPHTGIARAVLMDISGNAIREKKIEKNEQLAIFQVSDLPAGTYMIRIEVDGSAWTGKFVKE